MARPIVGVSVLAVLAVLLAASSCAEGRDFHVGGGAGWAPNPAEPFNTWAERNRFQVNDTLVFRYNKDTDAVLVVSPSHYDACNTTQPVLRLGGGDSRFVFNSSGPYFFISGDAGRCKAGERLIVVVLAVRGNGTSTPSPSLSPPPPKSSSSPTSPPTVATPAPGALQPPPPKSSSSPTSPPPVATPVPRASPLPPPAGKNASSPSLAPVPAPAPASTNGTSSPPSPSSAVALRGGVLACLVIGGAGILL